jgi:hypothetical protein
MTSYSDNCDISLSHYTRLWKSTYLSFFADVRTEGKLVFKFPEKRQNRNYDPIER